MSTMDDNLMRVKGGLAASAYRKTRLSLITSGLADLPIATSFLLVGILLWVFYRIRPDSNLPAADNEIFAYYIITQIPLSLRGLILSGAFPPIIEPTPPALTPLAPCFT